MPDGDSTSMPFSTPAGVAAMTKVFNIGELAELIILELDTVDIFKALRVCTTFNAHIAGSNKIQTRIAMSSDPDQDILDELPYGRRGPNGRYYHLHELLVLPYPRSIIHPRNWHVDSAALPYDDFGINFDTTTQDVSFCMNIKSPRPFRPEDVLRPRWDLIEFGSSWTKTYPIYPLVSLTINIHLQCIDNNSIEEDPISRGPVTEEMLAQFADLPPASERDSMAAEIEFANPGTYSTMRYHIFDMSRGNTRMDEKKTLGEIRAWSRHQWSHVTSVAMTSAIRPCRWGELLKIIVAMRRLRPAQHFYYQDDIIAKPQAQQALGALGLSPDLVSMVDADVRFQMYALPCYQVWD